jgi:hypothetical protein
MGMPSHHSPCSQVPKSQSSPRLLDTSSYLLATCRGVVESAHPFAGQYKVGTNEAPPCTEVISLRQFLDSLRYHL